MKCSILITAFAILVFNACSNNVSKNDENHSDILIDNLKLLKTGQNISYTKGDDGYFKKGINRNFTMGKNSVIDNVNKLQWQDEEYTNDEIKANSNQKDYGKVRTWEGAIKYCLQKGNAWRLPNIRELSTIINYSQSRPNVNSKLDLAFKNTTSGVFWSSTKGVSDYNSYVFTLQSNGFIGSSNYENNEVNYVRCVKSIR